MPVNLSCDTFLKQIKIINYKYSKSLIDVWRLSFCIAAFLALFCGHSALCWHGDGHNCGEDLYCQRGEEKCSCIFLLKMHYVLTLHVCMCF